MSFEEVSFRKEEVVESEEEEADGKHNIVTLQHANLKKDDEKLSLEDLRKVHCWKNGKNFFPSRIFIKFQTH